MAGATLFGATVYEVAFPDDRGSSVRGVSAATTLAMYSRVDQSSPDEVAARVSRAEPGAVHRSNRLQFEWRELSRYESGADAIDAQTHDRILKPGEGIPDAHRRRNCQVRDAQ